MVAPRVQRGRISWLELSLGIAILALLVELTPDLWIHALSALDVRTWSSSAWLIANVCFVVILLGVRFGKDLLIAWRARRQRNEVLRAQKVQQQQARLARELRQGIEESRRRRIY